MLPLLLHDSMGRNVKVSLSICTIRDVVDDQMHHLIGITDGTDASHPPEMVGAAVIEGNAHQLASTPEHSVILEPERIGTSHHDEQGSSSSSDSSGEDAASSVSGSLPEDARAARLEVTFVGRDLRIVWASQGFDRFVGGGVGGATLGGFLEDPANFEENLTQSFYTAYVTQTAVEVETGPLVLKFRKKRRTESWKCVFILRTPVLDDDDITFEDQAFSARVIRRKLLQRRTGTPAVAARTRLALTGAAGPGHPAKVSL
jgi:hypothetical protein